MEFVSLASFEIVVVALALLFAALPHGAAAHHSLAAFDHSKQIVIDGVVKSFTFSNPHSKLVVVEKQADGTWRINGCMLAEPENEV